MLELEIFGPELYNEETYEFIPAKKLGNLRLEHSLISISKWEAIHHKAFITSPDKTPEDMLDYIRCMSVDNLVDDTLINNLTDKDVEKIIAYTKEPMTATHIPKGRGAANNREAITSELIYYWMIKFNIPIEFQKWHINRLLTLINVCAIKETPPKKMSQSEIISRNRELNRARRAKYHSKG